MIVTELSYSIFKLSMICTIFVFSTTIPYISSHEQTADSNLTQKMQILLIQIQQILDELPQSQQENAIQVWKKELQQSLNQLSSDDREIVIQTFTKTLSPHLVEKLLSP